MFQGWMVNPPALSGLGWVQALSLAVAYPQRRLSVPCPVLELGSHLAWGQALGHLSAQVPRNLFNVEV